MKKKEKMVSIGIVYSLISYIEVPESLASHITGDWGECEEINAWLDDNNIELPTTSDMEKVETLYYRYDI